MSKQLIKQAREVEERVRENDPVCGSWQIHPADACIVRCDASSLAVGAALEIDKEIVEDISWMRPKGGGRRINISKLDAIFSSLNMA